MRANGEGTQVASGTGGLDNTPGGHPAKVWSYQHSANGYQRYDPVVGDFTGDGHPEVIGLSQGRVYLWNREGVVLAASVSVPSARIHGLYDLNGDGADELLVIAGNRIGLGLVVLDPSTLAVLWTSDDPGFNSGAELREVAVFDLDGDGIQDIVWNPAMYAMSSLHAVSFTTGFSDPLVLNTTLPPGYNNLVMPLAGNYLGTLGDPPTGLAIPQHVRLSFLDSATPGDPGAQCQGNLCLQTKGQFHHVTESHVFGTYVSFDADDDGDDELLSTSRRHYSYEVTAVDPSAGLAGSVPDTDAGVMWQYRYGVNSLINNRSSYINEATIRDTTSSTGQRIAPVTLYNASTDERDHYNAATDDCLENPNGWGVVVFDATRGTPLATLLDARALAQVDGDGDGTSEIVVQRIGGDVAGYELECQSADQVDNWLSCESTGCALVEAWSIPGALVVHKPQVMSPTSNHDPDVNTPSVLDLDGDDRADIVVRDGNDLVAYRLDPVLGPVQMSRYSTGACKTLSSVSGRGLNAWLLLEGLNCFAVLDAQLNPLASFSVEQTHGSGVTLTGHVGVPVIALGRHLIMDPLDNQSVLSLGRYYPVLFADFDQDGIDEVVALEYVVGNWRVAVFAWQGTGFDEMWSFAAADVGDTVSSFSAATRIGQNFAAGDFDGDGDPDLAIHPYIDYQPGQRLSPVYVLDGLGDGAGNGHLLASYTPAAPAYTRSHLLAADVCAGAICPGTDGRDELLVPGRRALAVYGLGIGLLEEFDNTLNYSSERALADFDGDGDADVATVLTFAHIGLMGAEVRDIDGTLRWTRSLDSAADKTVATAFADVNGDAAADFIYSGGYGQVEVYSGRDGTLLPGFPLYLSQGLAAPNPGPKPLPINQLISADIDGDGYTEALVAHQDGYVYALNVDSAEGPPAILWSVYYGPPIVNLRAADLDDDSLLEILAMARDGYAYIIDSLDAFVTLDQPTPEQCVVTPQIAVSGTSTGVDSIVVSVNGASVATVTPATGTWDAGLITLSGQGEFVISVSGLRDGVVITNAATSITHWRDDDGDGHSECTADCDDGDANTYPGATEICDGRDNDCDGVVPESELGTTIVGTASSESLDGSTGSDIIYGGDGSDHLHGNECADSLYGEAGDDELDGDDGDDLMDGGPGNDELDGEAGNDTMYGGSGDDELDGDDGDDILFGQDGDDELDGDAGRDRLNGGAGADNLDGDAGDDVVEGGAGDDFLHGSDGNDRLDGGDDDDRLIGDRGDDVIDGGDGFDKAYYTGAASEYITTNNPDGSVTIEDTVAGRDGTDILWNIESLRFDSSLPRT